MPENPRNNGRPVPTPHLETEVRDSNQKHSGAGIEVRKTDCTPEEVAFDKANCVNFTQAKSPVYGALATEWRGLSQRITAHNTNINTYDRALDRYVNNLDQFKTQLQTYETWLNAYPNNPAWLWTEYFAALKIQNQLSDSAVSLEKTFLEMKNDSTQLGGEQSRYLKDRDSLIVEIRAFLASLHCDDCPSARRLLSLCLVNLGGPLAIADPKSEPEPVPIVPAPQNQLKNVAIPPPILVRSAHKSLKVKWGTRYLGTDSTMTVGAPIEDTDVT